MKCIPLSSFIRSARSRTVLAEGRINVTFGSHLYGAIECDRAVHCAETMIALMKVTTEGLIYRRTITASRQMNTRETYNTFQWGPKFVLVFKNGKHWHVFFVGTPYMTHLRSKLAQNISTEHFSIKFKFTAKSNNLLYFRYLL